MRLTLTLLCFAVCQIAMADSWSDKLIETKKIDFGVIATGSEAIKEIVVQNVYDQPVTLAEVKTSCTCATGRLPEGRLNVVLQPGESVPVTVQMNTRLKSKKSSNLLIRFAGPRFVEHRIPVEAYIRTDVVINPGKLNFKELEYGNAATASVEISYAGRPDWNIENVKFSNPNMKATLSPPVKMNGGVKFKLTMALDNKAPTGPIREQIFIVTNDRTNPNIPLKIEGRVAPDISVSPGILPIGAIESGKTKKVQFLLRGKKAFLVTAVDCEGMSGCFKAELMKRANRIHKLVVEFTPPNRPGKFTEQLLVNIKGRPHPLLLNISGTIVN